MATNISFIDTLGGTSSLMVEAVSDIYSGVASLVTSAALTVYGWQNRVEQRRHLKSLDRRLMADMGLTLDQVDHEAEKPFWAK